jgi:hypothetical protein
MNNKNIIQQQNEPVCLKIFDRGEAAYEDIQTFQMQCLKLSSPCIISFC